MATYTYETIPQKPGAKPRRFDVQQSMKDEPLTRHPETGEPVRRIISGGYGFIAQHAAPPPPRCGCGGNCETCENN
jgi:predicted nucleic acid-binding Zn ribbon protein